MTNDQVDIIAGDTGLATGGGTLALSTGNFDIADDLIPTSGARWLGQGIVTILTFNPSGASANISCITLSNFELGHMKLTGTPLPTGEATVYFQYTAGDGEGLYIHDIYHDAANSHFSAFSIYVDTKRTIKNCLFERIRVISPDGNGFSHHGGADTDNNFTNITYKDIYVYRPGYAATRFNVWATGFDLGTAAFTLNDIHLINCKVEESWDSSFYSGETSTVKNRIIYNYCTSVNGGQKGPSTWGQFNLTNGDQTLNHCMVEGGTNAQYKIHNGEDGVDFTTLNECEGHNATNNGIDINTAAGVVKINGGVINGATDYGLYTIGSSRVFTNKLVLHNNAGDGTTGNAINTTDNSHFDLIADGTVARTVLFYQCDNTKASGYFASTGAYTIICTGDLDDFTIRDFTIADCTTAGIYFGTTTGASNVRILNGEILPACTTGIAATDIDDMEIIDVRIKQAGTPINIDNANMVRTVIRGTNSKGCTNDMVTTNATTPRITSNIDKDGAWLAGDDPG